MKFIVTLADNSKHEVDAQSFEHLPGVVTFLNSTRTPIAAFSGWVSIKSTPEPT